MHLVCLVNWHVPERLYTFGGGEAASAASPIALAARAFAQAAATADAAHCAAASAAARTFQAWTATLSATGQFAQAALGAEAWDAHWARERDTEVTSPAVRTAMVDFIRLSILIWKWISIIHDPKHFPL